MGQDEGPLWMRAIAVLHSLGSLALLPSAVLLYSDAPSRGDVQSLDSRLTFSGRGV